MAAAALGLLHIVCQLALLVCLPEHCGNAINLWLFSVPFSPAWSLSCTCTCIVFTQMPLSCTVLTRVCGDASFDTSLEQWRWLARAHRGSGLLRIHVHVVDTFGFPSAINIISHWSAVKISLVL